MLVASYGLDASLYSPKLSDVVGNLPRIPHGDINECYSARLHYFGDYS